MTKNIYYLIISFFIGFSMISCKKDTVQENKTPSNVTEVYAGVHDTTFNYYEFSSPLGVSIIWDNQNLYGVGIDSLDIDSDGAYDLIRTLNAINSDSLQLLPGMPNPFPSCLLNFQNNLEIAFYTESFPVGLGQSAIATFVDKLGANERIDLLSDWQAQQAAGMYMWIENTGGLGTYPFGDWYTASSESYIAVKMNGSKYGWIKIDASDPKDPKIVSFAIQK